MRSPNPALLTTVDKVLTNLFNQCMTRQRKLISHDLVRSNSDWIEALCFVFLRLLLLFVYLSCVCLSSSIQPPTLLVSWHCPSLSWQSSCRTACWALRMCFTLTWKRFVMKVEKCLHRTTFPLTCCKNMFLNRVCVWVHLWVCLFFISNYQNYFKLYSNTPSKVIPLVHWPKNFILILPSYSFHLAVMVLFSLKLTELPLCTMMCYKSEIAFLCLTSHLLPNICLTLFYCRLVCSSKHDPVWAVCLSYSHRLWMYTENWTAAQKFCWRVLTNLKPLTPTRMVSCMESQLASKKTLHIR